ncbi:MAG TPA: hypothetical protein VFV80_11475 [Geminicoccaceae bacterium]|nr:hypothetical protein [Geminicoccaceae bacterium]
MGEIAAIAVLGFFGVSAQKAFTLSAATHVLVLLSDLSGPVATDPHS